MSGDHRRLVLGIGLNKTGTSSVHRALETLGYRGLHWGGPETRALVRRAMDEGRPMLSYLEPGVEAITDLEEVTYNFELAARQYPQARFILTVRNLEDWVDSRRRHVEKNRRAKAAGEYQGTFLEIDEEAWMADYSSHEARVRAYFADRPADLLVFDIGAGQGWEPLCRFLGDPVPSTDFPWENRDPAGTESTLRGA